MAMDDWTLRAAAEINELRLEHPRYESVRRRLERALIMANPGEVIALCGPSRVGKTRCIYDVRTRLVGRRLPSDDRMPFVYVEVANEAHGALLRTKDFTADCLRAIRHPFYDADELGTMSPEAFDSFIHRTPEATLKNALERSLRARSTQVLACDEAQHIKHVQGGPRAAARLLDSWKCLASKGQIKLILAGSFELLDYVQLSPHLLGRLELISFDRYKQNDADDVRAWDQILLTVDGCLQFASREGTLREWNDLLYNGSLGCLGLLLKWIRRALASLDAGHGQFITRECLLATAFSKVEVAEIADEIRRGETAMQSWLSSPAQKKNTHTTSPRKATRKPFRRASKRIPLGGRA